MAAAWIGADEAARRLGVKPATLYSYVSRGVLIRRKTDDGRSVFDPRDVDRVAQHGRPRRSPGGTELVIESSVTMLGDDRHYYRGRDAIALADRWSLEQVAVFLWTGQEPEPEDAEPWASAPDAVMAAQSAQRSLSGDVLPLERLHLIVSALAVADRVRLNLEPAAVVLVGQGLISGMVDALPPYGAEGNVHERLWQKLGGYGADPRLADVLRFAMVLLADHELAASTLAVRVGASVRADPYAVVSAGLGVVSGALHGGASLGVEAMLSEIDRASRAPALIGERLRRGERIPGFGHAVYRSGDARGDALLERVRRAVPEHPRLAVAEAILDEARRRRLPAVNVDFALGLLTHLAGMPRGAGEAVFAVARTVGWLAHAMEEYARPTRLRLRAAYTGPLE
ncbi:citrate/2-methylcitrate synthase [Dactylosporangium sp. CA-139066]|uniref:citrate/2-methylcitrate synthase n=1 Tax=Dactylosporangium sp. CA-139066 TaxID=3239930 RepID=UPI003D93DDF0